MRAARFHGYGQPLVLAEVDTPVPGPGQVLVKVEGAGFCHSDVHFMDGAIRIEVLESCPFEVQFEVSLWGSLRELREVVALAERGRLPPVPLELAPLASINEVAARLRNGQVEGRVVITP